MLSTNYVTLERRVHEMKKLDDLKLTILPLIFLLILILLWKLTESVGAGMMVIIFWIGWRRLVRKLI